MTPQHNANTDTTNHQPTLTGEGYIKLPAAETRDMINQHEIVAENNDAVLLRDENGYELTELAADMTSSFSTLEKIMAVTRGEFDTDAEFIATYPLAVEKNECGN
jgi:hypothetical protein